MQKKLLLLFTILFLIFLPACAKKQMPPTIDVGRVYYEIFVRSFADSDGDGIGDFAGITQKLTYLEDLGVKGIWLMPIFPSPSYHGYDVTDYEDVNPQFGSLTDFENLVEEAHKKDIKVIIDFVINHSSTKHPWFTAAKDVESEYRNYYRFKSRDELKIGKWYSNSINGGSSNDYYYAYFWDQMPDLNYDNEAVHQQMVDIAKFWIDKGVDGFRFDAALHIFSEGELYNQDKVLLNANVDFWVDYRKKLRNIENNIYLVGEVWTSASTVAAFYKGLDSNFNFDLADLIIDTARGRGNLYYSKRIQMIYDNIKTHTETLIDAPFLRNHDQTRIMTELNNNMELAKLTAEMLLTLQGNPFIYYGEELGMKGDKPDEDLRSPFLWTDNNSDLDASWYQQSIPYNKETPPLSLQNNNPESLYQHYQTLIHLRNNKNALNQGSYQYVKSDYANLQMFMRISEVEEQALLIVHNFLNDDFTASLDTSNFNIIYQSKVNEANPMNVFAAKSTKIFEIPYDEYQNYLPE